MTQTVTIEFSNPEAATHFLEWLAFVGEQRYWDYMECREAEETKGDITALKFCYAWMQNQISDTRVQTICGRLDKLTGKE